MRHFVKLTWWLVKTMTGQLYLVGADLGQLASREVCGGRWGRREATVNE